MKKYEKIYLNKNFYQINIKYHDSKLVKIIFDHELYDLLYDIDKNDKTLFEILLLSIKDKNFIKYLILNKKIEIICQNKDDELLINNYIYFRIIKNMDINFEINIDFKIRMQLKDIILQYLSQFLIKENKKELVKKILMDILPDNLVLYKFIEYELYLINDLIKQLNITFEKLEISKENKEIITKVNKLSDLKEYC